MGCSLVFDFLKRLRASYRGKDENMGARSPGKRGKMKLTDTQCKNAKPAACAYKMFDGGGLHLEVMPNGSKLWRQKYYFRADSRKPRMS